MSRNFTLCHVMPRHVTSCHVMSRHVTSCHVMSHHVTFLSRHVTSRLATSCHVMPRHVMIRHGTSCHVESRGTVTRPTLHCQLTFSTRNWFEVSMTVFVGCPEGCRYHTASAVYDLVYYFFYSTFVLRNYPTDSYKIFRNCVFWCSLNNPIFLKFFWRHFAEKNAKTAKIWSKFHGFTQIFDNNFKTVKDNLNLKQIWTRGMVFSTFSANFILNGLRTAEIHLPNGVTKSVFLSNRYIFLPNSKIIRPICTQQAGKLCILK